MYKFIDTTEASESAVLPSEALKINGTYIENVVPGYRTLNVSGREALSPELDSYETGARDGSVLKSKRYPARTITVQYKLIAESAEAFRVAYNKLAKVLDVENAELIFNDETDKFFTGTPSMIGEVEPGRNSVVGEFEIFCADPFKYSVEEYVVEAVDIAETDDEGNVVSGKTFIMDYKGTYKSYPTFEAEFYSEDEISEDGNSVVPLMGYGDCGFIAFFNEDSNILQFGNPEEIDGIPQPEAQTLISQSFEKENAWGEAAQSLWTLNDAITTEYTKDQCGEMNPVIAGYDDGVPCRSLRASIPYPSTGADDGSGWHSATITRAIPADSSGYTGASSFVLTYSQFLNAGYSIVAGSYGAFQALLVAGNGDERKVVAGVTICANRWLTEASLNFIVNDKIVNTIVIDISYKNKLFSLYNYELENNRFGFTTIKKEGGRVAFDVAGITFETYDDNIRKTDVTELSFVFSKYAKKAYIKCNDLRSVKFVKHNCPVIETPNIFGCGDKLTANCRTAEVFHNNLSSPERGALGNDWEKFYLKPGANQINVAYSDWIEFEYAPVVKMRYREVFL